MKVLCPNCNNTFNYEATHKNENNLTLMQQMVVDLADGTRTQGEVASELRVPYGSVNAAVKGVRRKGLHPQFRTDNNKQPERDAKIYAEWKATRPTFRKLAKEYNLSPSRISRIVFRGRRMKQPEEG